MKIGFLVCDVIRPSLAAIHGSYSVMFTQLLSAVDPSIQCVFYDIQQQQFPQHLDECDAYIGSGSQYAVYDDFSWMLQLQDWIRLCAQANKGFVGICFSHQLMAVALGGKVEKSNKGWGVGVMPSQVHSGYAWMQPTQETIHLVVSHQDQVVALPKHAEVLLSNDFCPYAMIKVGSSCVSLQGHPEFTPQYAQDLMRIRQDSIGEIRVQQGIASLSQSLDAHTITHWLLNFLRSNL